MSKVQFSFRTWTINVELVIFTTMKKILLLFAILFLGIGVFSSCNKDNGGSKSSLIGTWKLVKIENYDEDGNLKNTSEQPYTRTLTFTESMVTVNEKGYTRSANYAYDKDSKRLVLGMVSHLVMKLTTTELAITDEAGYNGTGHGYDIYIYTKQ